MSDRLGQADADAQASTPLGNPSGGPVNGDGIAPEWAVLEPRYRLRERPAGRERGGACLAVDPATGREVRITRPHDGRRRPAGSNAPFLDRARAVSALDSPALVRVCGYGQDEYGCYLVTDAIESECLSDLLEQSGPLDVETVAPLARELTAALAQYHRRGLVHARLTAASIFIDDDGAPRLADACLLSGCDDERHDGTRDEAPAGRAAPELSGGAVADMRSDVWGLGAVLHQLLTGRLPDSRVPSAMPEPLGVVVLRAIAESPRDRFASAVEFHCEVCRALAATPLLPADPAERTAAPPEGDVADIGQAPPQREEAIASGTGPGNPAAPARSEAVPNFGAWYRDRFRWTRSAGAAPSYLVQALVWSGFGFAWIPAWYFASRGSTRSGTGASSGPEGQRRDGQPR